MTFGKLSHTIGLVLRHFDRLFADGDHLQLGSLDITVMETPGHTNDSVTYLVEDVAFIGDTLFQPSAGSARCDFPGGDAGQLYDSIQRLLALPDETRLLLCHDYPGEGEQAVSEVTVARQRAENVHLAGGTSRDEYIAMREKRDAALNLPRLILPSLLVNIEAGRAPAPENNGVSYLKTPFNKTIKELLNGSD